MIRSTFDSGGSMAPPQARMTNTLTNRTPNITPVDQIHPAPSLPPHYTPNHRATQTTPDPTPGVGSPPWATFLICTCTISTPENHVNASLCHPTHVCVVNGPAVVHLAEPQKTGMLVRGVDNVPGPFAHPTRVLTCPRAPPTSC